MRALKWIIDRCEGTASAAEMAIGNLPSTKDFDLEGMKGFTPADFEKATAYDAEGWRKDYRLAGEFFDTLGAHCPPALKAQLEKQKARVG